ncbi:MAG: hypothetical protein PHE68_04480 [Candidatus Peribacteraceae bacterium]|nr:hypothetical protein [Candidatus Peribacteraceae bacterium]MDD5074858.1 hypothetical protein [Candidatus Peribacteraceae bacterium]
MPEAQWDPLAYYDFPLRNNPVDQAGALDACVAEFAFAPLAEHEQVKRAERLSGISRSMRFALGIPERANTSEVQAVLGSFDGAVEAGILYRGAGKARMADSFVNICDRALSIRKQLQKASAAEMSVLQ